jgi:hypothetical protein
VVLEVVDVGRSERVVQLAATVGEVFEPRGSVLNIRVGLVKVAADGFGLWDVLQRVSEEVQIATVLSELDGTVV